MATNFTKESPIPLLLENDAVKDNIGKSIIATDEARIKVCINNHLQKIEQKKGWVTPMSLFLAILIVFPTTEFKDWGLSKSTWEAFFIISSIIFFLWLLKSIFSALTSGSSKNIIDDIKKTAIYYEQKDENGR